MDLLALILIGSWTFVIIFFSAVIAPTVFSAVDERNAGLFLRAFFPKYYYFGFFLGLAALLILSFAQSVSISFLIIIGLMLTLTAISIRLIPLINNARDAGESGKSRFKQFHLLSVILNFIILFLGVFFIYKFI
tara:strand:- start:364 stop:765 length:402 start_codon:yes stop_codon:yes gene_type:complete